MTSRLTRRYCEARQLDGVRCLARLRFGGRMPSMAAVARSLQEVFDDVEIVHLLTDAKAERTVVMTWRARRGAPQCRCLDHPS